MNQGKYHTFFPFPPFGFCTFWAALSWAFCCTFLSLVPTFFYPAFFATIAFFLYFIYLMAYSAKAFLSSGLAPLIFLIESRVTPSMALYNLRAFCFFVFPASDTLIFLCNLLHAVVHLNLWAFSFLSWSIYTLIRNFLFFLTNRGMVFRLLQCIWHPFLDKFSTRWKHRVMFWQP